MAGILTSAFTSSTEEVSKTSNESEKHPQFGNVLVTMLNISSAVESELKNVLDGSSKTVFGSDKCTHKTVEDGECYLFGPLELPDLLKDSFFGIFSVVHVSDKEGSYYLATLDIREQTGETFCNYETKIDKTIYDLVPQVFEKLNAE